MDEIDYMQNVEITQEVIDKVNELIGSDRGLLSPENSNELISKLRNKINSLKDNFIVNLPLQYNDEKEFLKLCAKISDLKKRLEELKDEHGKVKKLIHDFKSEQSRADSAEDCDNWHEELNTLLMKRISTKRKACYVKCLTRIEELKLTFFTHFQFLVIIKK
jgi:hypothetical protein